MKYEIDIGIPIDVFESTDVSDVIEDIVGSDYHSSGYGLGFRDMQFLVSGKHHAVQIVEAIQVVLPKNGYVSYYRYHK